MTDEQIHKKYLFLVYDGHSYLDGYSFLNDVPSGWRKIFLSACAKVKKRLLDIGQLGSYRLEQVKEKFGELCVYDNIVDTTDDHTGISDIWENAAHASSTTCITCGRKARWRSTGWICPFCTKCKNELVEKGQNQFKKIESV